MKNLKLFENMINEEVAKIDDGRFIFDCSSLSLCNTAYFYFKLGSSSDTKYIYSPVSWY